MGLLIPIDKEPVTQLEKQRVLLHTDSVYYFNPFTNIISIYCISESGFSYSVTRHNEEQIIKQFNFIWLNKLTREIGEKEFSEFVNQIGILQEQSHLLKPLVTFESYIEIIKQKLHL